MDEITLTCEACGVRYRLAASAVPVTGREVECSACGHTWFARPDAAPDDDDQDSDQAIGDEPRLTRPLSRDVLDILLGEVEHERKARAADVPPPATPAEADTSDKHASDTFWPATTLTDAPVTDLPSADPVVAPEPLLITAEPPVDPEPIRVEALPLTTEPVPSRPMAIPAATADDLPPPVAGSAPAQKPAALTTAEPSAAVIGGQPLISGNMAERHTPHARARAAAYRSGLAVAAMATLAIIALYLIAPAARNAGPAGAAIVEARAQVDAGRIWLKQQVATLFVVEMQR